MKRSFSVGLLTALTICAGSSAARSQHAETPPSSGASRAIVLTVSGKVPRPLKLDATALGRLPRKTVQAVDHDGKAAEYEGVPLVELLQATGLGFGPDELRGNALEYYLVVEAADGYRVVFALPELAPGFTDRVVLLADRRDGNPLDAKTGPLRIVVPGEKRHGRWVRQVTGLRVERVGD